MISPGGVLCYSKNFFDEIKIREEIVAGFLSAISDFAEEIKGGKIKTLNFGNFNLIYSYSDEFDFIFVIVADKGDIEREIRPKVEIMKSEFIGRYRSFLKEWTGNISVFEEFDEFVEKNIIIPPKILIMGVKGVGKKTIMDLFSGEVFLDIDDDLNVIPEKIIFLSKLEDIKQCIIKEIDMEELAYNTVRYKTLLNSVDVIIIITNSTDSNLLQTRILFSRIKHRAPRADFYLLANYQDQEDAAFEPRKIEEALNLRTYGFSAIKSGSKKKIMYVINDILRITVKKKFDAG